MTKPINCKTKLIVFISILLVEAVVLTILMTCTSVFENIGISLFTVPFAQIASGVKSLCLKGSVLRGFGMAILALLTFLPIAYALSDLGGKKSTSERLSLILLGIVLGGGTFLMMNPTNFLPEAFRSQHEFMDQATCAAIWSVILLTLATTGMRLLSSRKTRSLMHGFSAATVIIAILFVGSAVLSLGNLIRESASGEEASTEIENVVAFLKALKTVVPYILDSVIAVLLFRLAQIYISEEQKDLKTAAASVRKTSCALLGVTLVLSVGYNLVQVLCMKNIRNVSVVTELPVLSCVFVVVAVLVCNLIVENKDLKDDNELFV